MEKDTALQKYAEMQAMVQKEIQTMFPTLYQQYATKFGVAEVPLHRHNGFDSPKIAQQDIQASLATSGSITMSTNGTRYSIGLNIKPGSGFTPSVIRFNGIAINAAAPTIRALVVGDAFLGASFYLQPQSGSSVTVGGPPQSVIQSSSYILINNSGAGNPTAALASEGHIVSVEFPGGTVVARATIPDFGTYGVVDGTGPIQDGNLMVDVELTGTWRIIGNFVIM